LNIQKNNFKNIKLTFINTKNINIFLGKNIRNDFILLKNHYNNISLSVKFNKFFFKIKVKKNLLNFTGKVYFKCFLGLISSLIVQLKTGFFLEILLKGVGFNVYKKKNFLFFELGFSHYIGVYIPNNIIIKRFKARLAIFSFSRNLAHNFVKKLLLLKKVDAYKGKGIIYKNQKIILKEGKKR
jgi:large subunit ribosomal protein L6